VMLGLVVFRNDLKPDSADVVRELQGGAIECVMVTGDNALTAYSVATQVGIAGRGGRGRMFFGDVVGSRPEGRQGEEEKEKEGRGEKVVWRCEGEEEGGEVWWSDEEEMMKQLKVGGRGKATSSRTGVRCVQTDILLVYAYVCTSVVHTHTALLSICMAHKHYPLYPRAYFSQPFFPTPIPLLLRCPLFPSYSPRFFFSPSLHLLLLLLLQSGVYELCVTGAAFDILCNTKLPSASSSRMSALTPYTTIFARMGPEQKVRRRKERRGEEGEEGEKRGLLCCSCCCVLVLT